MKSLFNLICLLMMTTAALNAQENIGYQMPHQDILSLADAPMPPRFVMNTDGTVGLMLYRKPFISIAELSQEEMRLAGLRINPTTNISSRIRYSYNLTYFDIENQKEIPVTGLPDDPKIAYLSWSPDESMAAFTHTTEDEVHLYILDVASKEVRSVYTQPLNANMGRPYVWLADNSGFVVKAMPEKGKKLIDRSSTVPNGPTISVNEAGQKAQNRTYQDLLKNPVDEHNFEALANSVLIHVSIDGTINPWLDEGMYSGVNISPDGNYIMVMQKHRPFSYIVPYGRFPTSYTVYDVKGNPVKEIHQSGLIEELPKGFMSTRTGKRSITWRNDHPATLVWAEALDGGDPENEVPFRDAVYQWVAPFDGDVMQLTKTKLRYSGVEWGNENLAVIYDYWWNDRTLRTSFFNPSVPDEEQVLFDERNYQDNYSDPGNFVSEKNEFGEYTLKIFDGDRLMLIGDGYSDQGKHPFIDEYDISESSKNRLYQSSSSDQLESIIRMMDDESQKVLVRLESKDEFPNYYIRDLATGDLTPVTTFENPFSEIQGVHKEVITYQREDGLELSATLYLPVGYDKEKKEKMPMIMWAYPREYKDKSSASQVTSNSNEFTYPYYGSPLYWLNRGYVVLDDAAFPIIGEGEEEPNDAFIEQLVGNAKAGIDAVDALGYIDRNRVAVGGHSYGAFMTANLLTHSDLFAAGIARSGAYNRTLTPFGFQSEERNYWEAPNIYYEMSPFMHADKMKTPLLLIHGEADNNSGTYPMQSERYFNALKGLGAPVRLVMLPKESHGYAARESIMHMLWEQDQWLEQYVKNRKVNP